MYSEEIKRLIEQRNYLISIKEYIEIIRSPQVDHVTYKNQQFILWTNDGYQFKLQIKKEH